MKPEDVKIVFPLDVPSLKEAEFLMDEVGAFIDLPKVGYELIYNVGVLEAIAITKKFGKDPFVDVKLNDIPNTVKNAAKALTRHGVACFNVMASGGRLMMEAAVEGADEAARAMGIERPKIIAVTVLTSLTLDDLVEVGVAPKSFWRSVGTFGDEKLILNFMDERQKQELITEVVMRWSGAAISAGVDVILSSPKESAQVHARWPGVDLYSPGIRMPYSPPDDQNRTMTPGEAVLQGVRYLVIGRPIRNPEGGRTRAEVVQEIRTDIAKTLNG